MRLLTLANTIPSYIAFKWNIITIPLMNALVLAAFGRTPLLRDKDFHFPFSVTFSISSFDLTLVLNMIDSQI